MKLALDARAALLGFAEKLGSAHNALRCDENGDPRINGRWGHIYATPGRIGGPAETTYWLYIVCDSPRAWLYAKKSLSFCTLANDGDDEGAFWFNRLPTRAEAEVIRGYLGIRQTRAPPLNAFGGSAKREVKPELFPSVAPAATTLPAALLWPSAALNPAISQRFAEGLSGQEG